MDFVSLAVLHLFVFFFDRLVMRPKRAFLDLDGDGIIGQDTKKRILNQPAIYQISSSLK